MYNYSHTVVARPFYRYAVKPEEATNVQRCATTYGLGMSGSLLRLFCFTGIDMLTKVCTKCSVEKTVDCFSKAKAGKYGVSATCKMCYSIYHSVNKERIAEKKRLYYLKNSESISSQKKVAYSLNKEKVLSRNKKWKENNKDYTKDYNNINKQVLATKRKIYKQNNKEKYLAHEARRRANKVQASPSWVDDEAVNGMYQLATIFNRIGLNLHVDHIVPLNSDTVCGLHCEANLQLLPASDNISKGNRHWLNMW